MDLKELLGKALSHPLLSEPLKIYSQNTEDSIAKNEVLKALKKVAPLATFNKIPLEYDKKGKATNLEVATEASGVSRAVVDFRTDMGIHLYLSSCGNGSGKSFAMYWLAVALLTNSHPNINLGESKNPIGFMSNSRLIQEEFPKSAAFWLGDMEKLKSSEGCEVINPKGEVHVIKALTKDGKVNGFRNVTLGRDLMTFTYNQNWQALAGYNFSSFLIDEFGEIGKSGEEENTLTKKKFYELLVRVGRNGTDKHRLFALFFTIIPADWVYTLMDDIRAGKIAKTNPETGETRPFAKVLDGFSARNNPYINREQQEEFEVIARSLGDEDEISLRVHGEQQYDRSAVFPPFRRPIALTNKNREVSTPEGKLIQVFSKTEVIEKIQKKEVGWRWIIGMDSGIMDKFSYLIAAVHPIHGVYILDGISGKGLVIEDAVALIKEKEANLKLKNDLLVGRYFDRSSYKKRSQESPTPAYEIWQKNGIYAVESVSLTRDYNSIYTLIDRNLLFYSDSLRDLDKEIRRHKMDDNGKPLAKGGDDNIDAMRYIADAYHQLYYKQYHLAQEKISTEPEWKIKRRLEELRHKEIRARQGYSRKTSDFSEFL
jgi:hypothetical protein